MGDRDRVNLVALNMQAVLEFLTDYYGVLLGRGRTDVLLLVGCDDVVQYGSNCERQHSQRLLQDMLARWSLGLPDSMPAESTPGDTRPFEYLLNAMELAGQADNPAAAGYGPARKAVLDYVGDLVGKANRTKVV
jgi:hypothetical protein